VGNAISICTVGNPEGGRCHPPSIWQRLARGGAHRHASAVISFQLHPVRPHTHLVPHRTSTQSYSFSFATPWTEILLRLILNMVSHHLRYRVHISLPPNTLDSRISRLFLTTVPSLPAAVGLGGSTSFSPTGPPQRAQTSDTAIEEKFSLGEKHFNFLLCLPTAPARRWVWQWHDHRPGLEQFASQRHRSSRPSPIRRSINQDLGVVSFNSKEV